MRGFKKLVSLFLCSVLLFQNQVVFSQPQVVSHLPAPSTSIFHGFSLDPLSQEKMSFYIEPGKASQSFEQDALRMVRYFLTALTVDQDKIWVNLSPLEQDRILDPILGKTELGQGLLEQDYQLKKVTAEILSPNHPAGEKFWNEVYQNSGSNFSTSEMKSFQKVWVMPDQAEVAFIDGRAVIMQSRMKVLTDYDYQFKNQEMVSQKDQMLDLFREIVIPEIEESINSSEVFAPLRQIYRSVILATWFKNSMKESLLGQSYADQGKVSGVDVSDPSQKENIFQNYLSLFNSNQNELIQEVYDPELQKFKPVKYLTGGVLVQGIAPTTTIATPQASDVAYAMLGRSKDVQIDLNFEGVSDQNDAAKEESVTDEAMMAQGFQILTSGRIQALKNQLNSEQLKIVTGSIDSRYNSLNFTRDSNFALLKHNHQTNFQLNMVLVQLSDLEKAYEKNLYNQKFKKIFPVVYGLFFLRNNNPSLELTAGVAELYYRISKQFSEMNQIEITQENQEFFQRRFPDLRLKRGDVISSEDLRYQEIVKRSFAIGDHYLKQAEKLKRLSTNKNISFGDVQLLRSLNFRNSNKQNIENTLNQNASSVEQTFNQNQNALADFLITSNSNKRWFMHNISIDQNKKSTLSTNITLSETENSVTKLVRVSVPLKDGTQTAYFIPVIFSENKIKNLKMNDLGAWLWGQIDKNYNEKPFQQYKIKLNGRTYYIGLAEHSEEYQNEILSLMNQGRNFSDFNGQFIQFQVSNGQTNSTVKIDRKKSFSTSNTLTALLQGSQLLLSKIYRISLPNPDLENTQAAQNTTLNNKPIVSEIVGSIEMGSLNSSLKIPLGAVIRGNPNEGDEWGYLSSSLLNKYQSLNGSPLIPENFLNEFRQRVGLAGQSLAKLHLAWGSYSQPRFKLEEFQQKDIVKWLSIPKRQIESFKEWYKENVLEEGYQTGDFTTQTGVVFSESVMNQMNNFYKNSDTMYNLLARKLIGLVGVINKSVAHNDYHLGNIIFDTQLKTIINLDFEGAPNETEKERFELKTPLKDVGSMLDSFNYLIADFFLKAEITDAKLQSKMFETLRQYFLEAYASEMQKNPELIFIDGQWNQKSFEEMVNLWALVRTIHGIDYEWLNADFRDGGVFARLVAGSYDRLSQIFLDSAMISESQELTHGGVDFAGLNVSGDLGSLSDYDVENMFAGEIIGIRPVLSGVGDF